MILDSLPLTYKQISFFFSFFFFLHKEIKFKVAPMIKLQPTKVYAEVVVKCHTFLTVTLDESEGLVSCFSIKVA